MNIWIYVYIYIGFIEFDEWWIFIGFWCFCVGEFSCEIELDGKVILEGLSIIGCNMIKRYFWVFKMNIWKFCLFGLFKLLFRFLGLVDLWLFFFNFWLDGIFEVVVIR